MNHLVTTTERSLNQRISELESQLESFKLSSAEELNSYLQSISEARSLCNEVSSLDISPSSLQKYSEFISKCLVPYSSLANFNTSDILYSIRRAASGMCSYFDRRLTSIKSTSSQRINLITSELNQVRQELASYLESQQYFNDLTSLKLERQKDDLQRKISALKKELSE